MKEPNKKMLDAGKLPPQAPELEEAVIGAILLEDCISSVSLILHPQSFYIQKHSQIYQAVLRLYEKSHPIDLLTIVQELKRTNELDEIGGAYFVSSLTNRVASSSNVEFHARIIQQKFIQREIIRISSQTINKAFEEGCDVFDVLESAEHELYKITAGNIKNDLESTSALVGKAIKEIEKAGQNVDGTSGVPSGIRSIDKITGGWQKSDLIIVAGRPAMGKTAFVISVASNASFQFNKKVAVFSLEMSKMQLIKRLISSEAEINAEYLKTGRLSSEQWNQLNERVERMYSENLFIDDTPSLSVVELKAKARRFKEKFNCELIVVDYLQLMSGEKGSKGNREQEIAYISRSLKALAKDIDVPIIALSQLSRAVESRGGDKRPQLSDLRESGAIEQDADMVIFLHRPEYYGITEDANGSSTAGYAEAIIAKHRNGATDSASMRFVSQFTKFIAWDTEPHNSHLNPNKFFESEKEEF